MNVRKLEKSAKQMVGVTKVSTNLAGNVSAFKGKANKMINGENTTGNVVCQLQKNTKKLLD